VQAYASLKRNREGLSGFDRYFAAPNNAVLISISTYTQFVPAFNRLLAQQQGDLSRFYAAVKTLARLPKPERDTALARLSQG
jgi:predicted aminopeptidase